MYSKKLRPAVAMVELIFAIVIMGIAMMSAPLLISTASKGSTVAIQQEGINEASTRVAIIMSYAWDENNTDEMYIPPILHVTDGHSELDELDNSGRRVGTPDASQRTFMLSDSNSSDLNASTSLASDDNDDEEDDIDDFVGNVSLTLIGGSTETDYIEKDTINIKTELSYVSDDVEGGYSDGHTINFIPFQASSGTTNIKDITVTLTSTSDIEELNKTIVLRAFSCNIGGYKLEEKVF